MYAQKRSKLRTVKRRLDVLVRFWPLMRYGKGQHDLICDALRVGKDYQDEGSTAYEAVCVLMMKLENAKEFIERQDGDESKKLLQMLEAHHDSEEFCVLPLFGTGD